MNNETLSTTVPDAAPAPVPPTAPFVERRSQEPGPVPPGQERRQFCNGYAELSPEARELAQTIDRYKMQHRRRLVSYEEILTIVKQLGYQRPAGE